MRDTIQPNVAEIDRQRKVRGWTWTALSRKAGLAQSTRTRLIQGRPVQMNTIRRVAALLGVRPGRLIAKTAGSGTDYAAILIGEQS